MRLGRRSTTQEAATSRRARGALTRTVTTERAGARIGRWEYSRWSSVASSHDPALSASVAKSPGGTGGGGMGTDVPSVESAVEVL